MLKYCPRESDIWQFNKYLINIPQQFKVHKTVLQLVISEVAFWDGSIIMYCIQYYIVPFANIDHNIV